MPSSLGTGLAGPAPLNVDTDLMGTGGSGIDGIDASEFTTQVPVASFEDFQSNLNDGSTSPMGYSSGVGGLAGAALDTVGGAVDGSVRSQIVDYAKKFLGMQYKWGGSNPSTSFDCSGFVQYVTGKFGVHLPRVSYQQVNSGTHVALNKLQPGDIVGWDNSSRNNGADHVALYIGNGQIMEFYKTGKPSRIRKLGSNEGAIGVHLDYGK
jgi:cell wall-associated NlpC family hydrolase